uniref:Uncharacterized protein n=1 Tax=Romanomermis culicivorax TaxID=13658 RepID=A0A915JGB6_ROMCU
MRFGTEAAKSCDLFGWYYSRNRLEASNTISECSCIPYSPKRGVGFFDYHHLQKLSNFVQGIMEIRHCDNDHDIFNDVRLFVCDQCSATGIFDEKSNESKKVDFFFIPYEKKKFIPIRF